MSIRELCGNSSDPTAVFNQGRYQLDFQWHHCGKLPPLPSGHQIQAGSPVAVTSSSGLSDELDSSADMRVYAYDESDNLWEWRRTLHQWQHQDENTSDDKSWSITQLPPVPGGKVGGRVTDKLGVFTTNVAGDAVYHLYASRTDFAGSDSGSLYEFVKTNDGPWTIIEIAGNQVGSSVFRSMFNDPMSGVYIPITCELHIIKAYWAFFKR